MRVYVDGDGVEFVARFEATPGVPTVPPSVHWRLRCMTNNQVLRDWTEVPSEIVAESGVITAVRAIIEVDGELNAIQDTNNRRETKQLQVMAARGTARQKSELLEYAVANGNL